MCRTKRSGACWGVGVGGAAARSWADILMFQHRHASICWSPDSSRSHHRFAAAQFQTGRARMPAPTVAPLPGAASKAADSDSQKNSTTYLPL